MLTSETLHYRPTSKDPLQDTCMSTVHYITYRLLLMAWVWVEADVVQVILLGNTLCTTTTQGMVPMATCTAAESDVKVPPDMSNVCPPNMDLGKRWHVYEHCTLKSFICTGATVMGFKDMYGGTCICTCMQACKPLCANTSPSIGST